MNSDMVYFGRGELDPDLPKNIPYPKMCYCRRDSHARGSIEKCIAAPSWLTVKNQRDTLLEACEAMVKVIEHKAALRSTEAGLGASEWESFIPDGFLDEYPQARAAIQKARGER